jgi:catechol 2,3-dioxygenase-like lactoylglutathione lyase family enzyme
MAACTTPKTEGVSNGGARWDGFCWGIEPWDTNKVETALKARGLNPVADHSGDDFRSFHVKDPDGMDVQISNGNKRNRRRTPANGKLDVPLPFEPTGWRTMYLDHISFAVTSYKESVAFYEALLGWKGLGDEGSQNETMISPEIGGLLIRGGNASAPTFVMPPARRAIMNHISFGITPFDPDKVWAELCARGLQTRVDTGAIASSPDREKDIHTATYKSFHTRTPNNYDLQISSKISGSQTGGG